MGLLAWLLLAAIGGQSASAGAVTVLRCRVTGDSDARVYDLQRAGEGSRVRWTLAMRSREAGSSPVLLPLPGAKPELTATSLTLVFQTQNGGRHVDWRVTSSGATLDVHANFELEVNVDADLDRRVDLMNTDGAITNLACAIEPVP